MQRLPWRYLVGGALTASMFAGCSSRTPFATDLRSTLSDDPATATRLPDATPAFPDGWPDADVPDLGEDATLDDYLRYAAMSNQALEARFHEWQAATERLPQVRALPDPRITYGYYLGEVETRVGPMQHTVSVAQTLPWFGKLSDREDIASRHAASAYQRLEATRLQLYYEVEQAYNELAFLHRSIEITDDAINLLQQFDRAAQIRYRVAAASHPDLIKVQVELAETEDRLRRLHDLRAPYTARLNAALNRPVDAKIPWPETISERVTDLDVLTLSDVLKHNSPDLLAIREEIERERIASDLARKDGYPDLTVGLAYTAIDQRIDTDLAENGDDAVLATFSINLPIWREKYDAGVREALSRRLAASGRHGDLFNRTAHELQEATFQHDDARRRIELYQDTLIPKATESLQSSLGAFEQNKSDFFDLLDTQRTLLEFQLAYERALVDRATSYARIEQLIGMPLNNVDMLFDAPLEDLQ